MSNLDFGGMSEEELDAAIYNNPSEHDDVSESGNTNYGDVSPLDDTEEQADEPGSVADDDQADDGDEDLGSISSTEEDETGDELEGSMPEDETGKGNLDSEDEGDLKSDEEQIAFQPLRAAGREYPIESLQELYTFASKGIDADRKWAESAEGRRIASTMKANGLDMNDINILIEAKQGNQDAIMSFLKANNIDPLDMDADAFNGYKPKDHSTGDFELQLDDVVSRIKTNPRYDESVNVVMDKWDSRSREAFYRDPNLLELLNIDMQVNPDTGFAMYDKVAPLAEKLKILDHGRSSDLEYYMQAGQRVLGDIAKQNQIKTEAENRTREREASKKAEIARKRKAAASSGGNTAGKKSVDVTELSDEDLDRLLDETN